MFSTIWSVHIPRKVPAYSINSSIVIFGWCTLLLSFSFLSLFNLEQAALCFKISQVESTNHFIEHGQSCSVAGLLLSGAIANAATWKWRGSECSIFPHELQWAAICSSLIICYLKNFPHALPTLFFQANAWLAPTKVKEKPPPPLLQFSQCLISNCNKEETLCWSHIHSCSHAAHCWMEVIKVIPVKQQWCPQKDCQEVRWWSWSLRPAKGVLYVSTEKKLLQLRSWFVIRSSWSKHKPGSVE